MPSPLQQAMLMVAPSGSIAGPPVSGLVGWYDASVFSSLTIDGSNFCNAAADLSGNGNDIIKSAINFAAPAYVANGLNSRPTLEFFATGNGGALSRNPFAFGTSPAYTFFFVGTLNAASTNFGMFGCYLATGQSDYNNQLSFTVPRNGTTTGILTGRNATAIASADFGAYDTIRRVIAVAKANGTQTIYIDGVAGTPGTGAAATNFGTTGWMMIGNINNGGVSGITAHLSEIGLCNADNTSQVAALDLYLKNKWGL